MQYQLLPYAWYARAHLGSAVGEHRLELVQALADEHAPLVGDGGQAARRREAAHEAAEEPKPVVVPPKLARLRLVGLMFK